MIEKLSIIDFLKEHLGEDRYNHSIGVSSTAKELANHYGYDVKKAEIAGLLHDCAKEHSIEEQICYARNCGFFVDDMTYKIPELLHAPASVYICREIFKINDMDILSSIRYHATGKENMAFLEKLILVSDIIEPKRCFQGVEKIREKVYYDINTALLYALDSSINYIVRKGFLIHPDTIFARNYIIEHNISK